MLNFSIRPVLWIHKLDSKGKAPIMICVTINRQRTYKKTSYKIAESQWKDGEIINHPNAKVVNAAISKQISELEEEITIKQLEGSRVTAKSIKKKAIADKTFAAFAKEVRADNKEINRITLFGGESLQLSEITVSFLRKYDQHEKKRGMSQNTRNTTFKYLRRIINQAKAEGLIKSNPFEEYDIPRYVQSDRIYLVEDERNKMLSLLDKKLSPGMRSTLTFFLFGCYSGLRHSDWCRFSPDWVQDGFLKLRAKKNKASVVLPVGPTLARIITQLEGKPHSNQKCNVHLKALGVMAGIEKEITTHTGRHSFGYLCASNRLPKSVTAELLGVTAKTVEVYYHLSGANIIEQANILTTI
jgi:site-specific recombinase XerD